jgi:hypothetical protein
VPLPPSAFLLTTVDSRYEYAVFVLRHGSCSITETTDGNKKENSDGKFMEKKGQILESMTRVNMPFSCIHRLRKGKKEEPK